MSSHCGAVEINPTRNHEVAGSIPGLAQWVKDLTLLWCRSQTRLGSGVVVSCGVSHRNGSDPVFLWLRHRPVATALIRSLTWEPPHAMGVALEKTKRQKKKKRKKERNATECSAHSKNLINETLLVNTTIYYYY